MPRGRPWGGERRCGGTDPSQSNRLFGGVVISPAWLLGNGEHDKVKKKCDRYEDSSVLIDWRGVFKKNLESPKKQNGYRNELANHFPLFAIHRRTFLGEWIPHLDFLKKLFRFLVCVVNWRKTGPRITHRADQFVGVDGPQKAEVAQEATDDQSHLRKTHMLPKVAGKAYLVAEHWLWWRESAAWNSNDNFFVPKALKHSYRPNHLILLCNFIVIYIWCAIFLCRLF